jgi:hypothetical protein
MLHQSMCEAMHCCSLQVSVRTFYNIRSMCAYSNPRPSVYRYQCVIDAKYDAVSTINDEMTGRNGRVEYEIEDCRVKYPQILNTFTRKLCNALTK